MKYFFFKSFIIFFVVSAGQWNVNASPFPLDKMYFGVEMAPKKPKFLNLYLKAFKDNDAIGIVGRNAMDWNEYEPKPPINRKHNYRWTGLDKEIALYQKYGFRMQVVVRCRSQWACRNFDTKNQVAMTPPKAEHWDDWQEFIRAFVERYDADGFEDMPGIKTCIPYIISIGAEQETKFDGTPQELEKITEYALKGARQASDKVKVARAATHFPGGPFEDSPGVDTSSNRLKQRKILPVFFQEAFRSADRWDLFGLHIEGSYESILPMTDYIRHLMRAEGFVKPIFSEDTFTVPHNRYQTYGRLHWEDENDNQKGDVYETLTEGIKSPKYDKAKRRVQKAQSNWMIKKLAFGLVADLDHMIMSTGFDWPSRNPHHLYWRYSGLVDASELKLAKGDVNAKKVKKPLYYAVKLFFEKLHGSTGVNIVRYDKSPATCVLRFDFAAPGKSVYLAWSDKPYGAKHNLKLNGSTALITQNIEVIDQKEPVTVTQKFNENLLQLNLSETPVYVEIVK